MILLSHKKICDFPAGTTYFVNSRDLVLTNAHHPLIRLVQSKWYNLGGCALNGIEGLHIVATWQD